MNIQSENPEQFNDVPIQVDCSCGYTAFIFDNKTDCVTRCKRCGKPVYFLNCKNPKCQTGFCFPENDRALDIPRRTWKCGECRQVNQITEEALHKTVVNYTLKEIPEPVQVKYGLKSQGKIKKIVVFVISFLFLSVIFIGMRISEYLGIWYGRFICSFSAPGTCLAFGNNIYWFLLLFIVDFVLFILFAVLISRKDQVSMMPVNEKIKKRQGLIRIIFFIFCAFMLVLSLDSYIIFSPNTITVSGLISGKRVVKRGEIARFNTDAVYNSSSHGSNCAYFYTVITKSDKKIGLRFDVPNKRFFSLIAQWYRVPHDFTGDKTCL